MSSITARPMVDDRREIRGWAMYDWANSAFSTTVGTVFLGPYVTELARAAAGPDGMARFLGFGIAPASFLPFAISFSVALQVFFLPILGAIADYSHIRKQMLMFFAILGASLTIAMFFVTAPVWWLGGVLFLLANLSFGAAIVFYNAYLPDIASEDQRDRVSSFGWAMGYLGGGLLLLFNLIFFQFSENLGISSGLAVRINLASAGLWWLGFSVFTWRRLRSRRPRRELPAQQSYISAGFKQLGQTFRELRYFPQTVRFLVAYLIYNDGVQTVIAISAIFGAEELGLDVGTLSMVILVVQFVAFFGALFFGWLAGRTGTKRALVISLVIWSSVVIYAYGFLYDAAGFFILGVAVGLVMGGSQALSRSMFSQMIPIGREAEYFSLYEISERGTSWLGPFVFALVNQFTGSLRLAILSVILFFVLGLFILLVTNTQEAIAEARRAELPADPLAA
ncbi:MAG: MFS transporter [Anaerolineae bacterium]|nr:MFS transporter [Anaerolineae bacterium]MCB0200722.1 MFS transporter [Anaerolineae bacterium]MCB0253394.1 MFS transporter [Anaerolineae bacterium]